jgi:hypothetical protein
MKKLQQEAPSALAVPGHRSGVAARLAGLSAATLRVWERRYRLTATERSSTGQRLYSAPQVRRLGVLKQLVDQGHAIGTLAALPDERLLDMLDAGAAGPLAPGGAAGQGGVLDVAAIGAGLVQRLAAAIGGGLPLRLHGSAASLGHTDQLTAGYKAASVSAGPLVLLIELAEPDGSDLEGLVAARARVGAAAAVVMYRFCSSATVRTLRAGGFLVARFPAELGELPLLCRAALQRRGAVVPALVRPLARASTSTSTAGVSAPRFDDVTLAAIGQRDQRRENAAGGAGHEGARMLADMLLQVGSFERYSARCAAGGSDAQSNDNASDAALHRHLELVSGKARLLLEGAMDRLLRKRR